MKNNLITIKKAILNVLVGITFLSVSACDKGNSYMKKGEESKSNGINHYSDSNLEEALCSVCEGNYRNFYTLPDEEKTVVLFCEGCYSLWLDKEHIGFGEQASEEILVEKFERGFNSLIEDAKGHWSDEYEVNDSEWNSLMLNNRSFLHGYVLAH